MFYNKKWVHDYLIALKDEIKDQYMGEKIETLYIGGGTPSCLEEKELKYLLELTTLLEKTENLEFTFECNLNDITENLLKLLQEYGVNRLSIGIESFNEQKLILMGRNHIWEDAENKMKLIRKIGFTNVSVDFIYGFPKETKKDLKKDIKQILKLNPDHVSTYSLMIEPHTLLTANKIEPISEDLDSDFYRFLRKILKKHKFHHYEISNFAKETKESKHNLKYWNNEEYYGFGLSASGYIDSIRYTNTKNLTKYLKHEIDGEKELLAPTDIIDYEVMLGLRKVKGIHLETFEKKYGVSLEEAYPIKPLLKSKELKKKNGYIFINPEKLYVMNEILMKLL